MATSSIQPELLILYNLKVGGIPIDKRFFQQVIMLHSSTPCSISNMGKVFLKYF